MNKSVVKYYSEEVGSYQIELMDLEGRVVYSKSGMTQAGSNEIELELNSINAGAYMVKFKSGTETQISKLIKE